MKKNWRDCGPHFLLLRWGCMRRGWQKSRNGKKLLRGLRLEPSEWSCSEKIGSKPLRASADNPVLDWV